MSHNLPFPIVSSNTRPDDPPLVAGYESAFKSFTNILGSHQIASASSPKRSHTINIPSTASLKRSSTTAASFIRSRGKYFTQSGHSKEPSHDNDSQRSPGHRRIASASMTIRRSATTATSYIKGRMKPRADPVNGNPQPSTDVAVARVESEPPQEVEGDGQCL